MRKDNCLCLPCSWASPSASGFGDQQASAGAANCPHCLPLGASQALPQGRQPCVGQDKIRDLKVWPHCCRWVLCPTPCGYTCAPDTQSSLGPDTGALVPNVPLPGRRPWARWALSVATLTAITPNLSSQPHTLGSSIPSSPIYISDPTHPNQIHFPSYLLLHRSYPLGPGV